MRTRLSQLSVSAFESFSLILLRYIPMRSWVRIPLPHFTPGNSGVKVSGPHLPIPYLNAVLPKKGNVKLAIIRVKLVRITRRLWAAIRTGLGRGWGRGLRRSAQWIWQIRRQLLRRCHHPHSRRLKLLIRDFPLFVQIPKVRECESRCVGNPRVAHPSFKPRIRQKRNNDDSHQRH